MSSSEVQACAGKKNFEKVLLLQRKPVELPFSTEGFRIRAFYSNLL